MLNSGIIKPEIILTKYALALVEKAPKRYYLDYKKLERNKYAPWGRGSASKMKDTK